MTKQEFVKAVAEKAEISQKKAAQAVEAFLETIREAASRGETVQLVGFGAFVVKDRAARAGRDPRTGAEIEIPARRVVVFRPGKQLKSAVVAG